jgi:hypothetical protein
MPIVNKERVKLAFLSKEGDTVGYLHLFSRSSGNLAQVDPEALLMDLGDLGSFELQAVQLLESSTYEFKLEGNAGDTLKTRSSSVLRFSQQDPAMGWIETGNFVGLLSIALVRQGYNIGYCSIDVQSYKAGALRDYCQMIHDIAERSTELMIQMDTPVMDRMAASYSADAQTLAQRFYFLKSLIGSNTFRNSIQRILERPHVKSAGTHVEIPISRGGFAYRWNEVRQLVQRTPRSSLPQDHYLRSFGLDSIPTRITTEIRTDFLDNAENRFVKFALQHFLHTLEDIAEKLKRLSQSNPPHPLVSEVESLSSWINRKFTHPFFKEISRPNILPLGSPVLQRKEGYRQLLKAWLGFDTAASLVWQSGDDSFETGKRDVSTLYEYWVFFLLHQIAVDLFQIESPTKDLIDPENGGLTLKLKAGVMRSWLGKHSSPNGLLSVRFSYNRAFSGVRANESADTGRTGKASSWTQIMRPDYTFSFWPSNLKEYDAEEMEQIIHLHFDAKYKVQITADQQSSIVDVVELFSGTMDHSNADLSSSVSNSSSEKDLADEKEQERRGLLSKRADLIKMHAYRDAIRRTEGAFILYPGDAGKRNWQQYAELLPGIGAFSVPPGNMDSIKEVQDFLLEAADLFASKTSQLYRKRFWHESIVKERTLEYTADHNFGTYGEKNSIQVPPNDETCLLGFIRPQALEVCKDKGVFYFHAAYDNGESNPIDPGVFSAKYFVPYSNFTLLNWKGRITNSQLLSRLELIKLLGEPNVLSIYTPAVTHYYVVRFQVDSSTLNATIADEIASNAELNAGQPVLTTWGQLLKYNMQS